VSLDSEAGSVWDHFFALFANLGPLFFWDLGFPASEGNSYKTLKNWGLFYPNVTQIDGKSFNFSIFIFIKNICKIYNKTCNILLLENSNFVCKISQFVII